MHHRRLVLTLVLAVAAAALLLPAAALAAPAAAHGSGMLTYDQAVDYLFAKGYPANIETYLNNLGTSPLGYRLAGTPSDNQAARYIADKLRGMGLSNVHLERVPVDVWDVRGASVTVDGTEYICSQFAGVPGVDEPVTADVVYLGNGLAADYDSVDVKGKIVLVDSAMDSFWFNLQGAEASKHGAAAVILTSNYSDPDPTYPSFPWYSWRLRRPRRQRRRVRHGLGAHDLPVAAGRRHAQGRDRRGRAGRRRGHLRQRREHHDGRRRRLWLQRRRDAARQCAQRPEGHPQRPSRRPSAPGHRRHRRRVRHTGHGQGDDAQRLHAEARHRLPLRHRRGVRLSPTAGTTGASAPGTSSPRRTAAGPATSPPCGASSSWRARARPSTSTPRRS